MMKNKPRQQFGFTLLEASIAIVLVGLLMSGGIAVLSHVIDSNRYHKTTMQLEDIKETINAFYVNRFYLPCPDVDGDGIEDIQNAGDALNAGIHEPNNRTPVVCTASHGYLPYASLGVVGQDSWGQPYKYAIASMQAAASQTPTLASDAFTACTQRDLRHSAQIRSLSVSDLATPAVGLAQHLGYVVLSHGKNGAQTNAGMTSAFSGDGGCLQVSALEQENCTASTQFRYGLQMSDSSSIQFDDLMVWMSDFELSNLVLTEDICQLVGIASLTSYLDPSKDLLDKDNLDESVHKPVIQKKYGLVGGLLNELLGSETEIERKIVLKEGNNFFEGNVAGPVGVSVFIEGTDDDDIFHVEGNLIRTSLAAQSYDINMKSGNDVLEVTGNVQGHTDCDGCLEYPININMGDGNDVLRIHGAVQFVTADMGKGDNVVYLNALNMGKKVKIKTQGKATIYLDNAKKITGYNANVMTEQKNISIETRFAGQNKILSVQRTGNDAEYQFICRESSTDPNKFWIICPTQ